LLRRVTIAFVLVALGAAGLAVAFAATGSASPRAADATVKITVNATEFRFTLSKRTVPVGSTVAFTVVNKGKISHDFKIAGKKTRTLNPGQSQTITVKFGKKGRFGYLCTLQGHAAAGMKGSFSVGVAAVKPPPVTSTTTTTTTTTTTPTVTGPIGNAQTTVNVGMFEYRFDMDKTTFPSGQVTFVITNRGQEVHNFSITGVKAGALLSPGQTETWTVGLPARTYNTVCDVPFHADRGMVGSFTVTP
jgi:uncharacterized cupredoxin-like copper-binding protein